MRLSISGKALLVSGALGALVAGITPIASAVSASATTTTTLKALTTVTNRDDSGAHGNNWALDNFARKASITFHGSAQPGNCNGISPCYQYTGSVTDKGHFTTDTGQLAPGYGYENGGGDITLEQSVTGTMSGHISYLFYATAPLSAMSASAVPSSVNGDTYSTQQWPELFAGTPGITFCDTSGNCGTPAPGTTSGGPEALGTNNWGWTYRAGFGSDSACPNVGSQWVDSYPSAGSAPAAGNILAPDASHC